MATCRPRAGQSACCAAKPDEAATSVSTDEEEPQGPLSPDSLKSIEDDEKQRDRQMELALRAGLSEAESEVVTELFAQAANNEDWLHVDGLKEMMRCALPAPPAARRLLTCSQRCSTSEHTRICGASGFTLQLDEHQLKNILVDVRMNHHAETMEPPATERDDLINYKQFAWLINGVHNHRP